MRCAVLAAGLASLSISVASDAAAQQAAPEGVAPPPAGKGQVVFFRDKALKASGFTYPIRQDGKIIVTLGRGTYFVLPTEPGPHDYTVQSEVKDALHMEVEVGETYFVRQTMDIGMLITTARLTPSDQATFSAVKPKALPAKVAD